MKWSLDAIRKSMLVYAVTDRAWLNGRTLAECVQQAVDGGERRRKMTGIENRQVRGENAVVYLYGNLPVLVIGDYSAKRSGKPDLDLFTAYKRPEVILVGCVCRRIVIIHDIISVAGGNADKDCDNYDDSFHILVHLLFSVISRTPSRCSEPD